eukprot:1048839-Amphidinium_carterae.1
MVQNKDSKIEIASVTHSTISFCKASPKPTQEAARIQGENPVSGGLAPIAKRTSLVQYIDHL